LTTLLPREGVQFRVWAPIRKKVEAVVDGRRFPLKRDAEGYFSGVAKSAQAGSLYQFQLDDDGRPYPDPESRFQPDGPHGPSQVIDPSAYEWNDSAWRGPSPRGQVVYEMHIGTFTPEGTWNAARAELRELASVGITMLEVMPIAEFSGRWGWGYDGVDLFAPTRLYGSPEDAKRFIDEAHAIGIAVILDVVYNHFGPDGNYLNAFAPQFFTDKFENDWGEAIDFSRNQVRDFYIRNAVYWMEEFHFDGLRLDATQDLHDLSDEHILAAMTKRVREAVAPRKVFIVAENEPQNTCLIRDYGLDAMWNDDLHHAALTALTGRNEAYYTDYKATPQEFVSAAKYGYLYQGQWYSWQKKRRGTPALDLEPWNFVTFLQNHDQVANSARGERPNTLANPSLYCAMTAFLILAPGTPMLFQGQEFGATTPFLFFCDHGKDLARQVRKGRARFLSQFRSLAQKEIQKTLPDPNDPDVFQRSRLDFGERLRNRAAYDLHKDLLRLRHEDPVFSNLRRGGIDGAVLSHHAFALRYFNAEHGDRLLIVNTGADLHLNPAPEPLLAPPPGSRWKVLFSSEHPKYGGNGTFPPDTDENWRIPGYSALAFEPAPVERNEDASAC
jgi:maltooligosyltrehalose trehalohydrolase